jgi:hypothetical protein
VFPGNRSRETYPIIASNRGNTTRMFVFVRRPNFLHADLSCRLATPQLQRAEALTKGDPSPASGVLEQDLKEPAILVVPLDQATRN